MRTIKASDYEAMPADALLASDGFYSDAIDGTLMRLFGEVPDYSEPSVESLWQRVRGASQPGVITFCRDRGVDVLHDDGTPVAAWRHIAVLLLSRDDDDPETKDTY